MTLPAPFGPHHFVDYALMARLGMVLDELRRRGEARLPSESELCRRLEVDRPQLHRVLQTLGREGILQHVRSKGWYFAPAKLEIPVARHNSYSANMLQQKKLPRSEVIGVDQVAALEGSSDFFSADCGRLWVLDFRRYDGDRAFSVSRVLIPADQTPRLNVLLGRSGSLYRTLQEHFGIRPERRHTWCEAVAADTSVAESLGVAVAAVLLKTTHHAYWGGRPFERAVNYLRSESCRVRIDLAVVEEETP